MRLFYTKICLFSFVLGAIFITLELWVRSVPNEYSYKYEYLENNIDKIEILCVGSSAARSGINPDLFQHNTFNVAQVSQDLEQDCAILQKYINRADSLKIVLFLY